MKDDSDYLRQVRAQYENYPYPARDPEDERRRLLVSSPDFLERINFYGYGGMRELREKDFRVLVAGAGTGDAVLFLAEQLRDTGAEIIYLDMSAASMEIAQKRAAIRNLKNITWVHDSLLELPRLNIGKIDYINCSGVLHHLEKPENGLSALASVLKEDGLISIMLYGQYGRTALYMVQEMLKRISGDDPDMQARVEDCKKLLPQLSPTHWFNTATRKFSDMQNFGDVGYYDLFLHSHDRAYTVPQLYDFLASANLAMVHYLATHNPVGDRILDPEIYVRDADLVAKIKAKDKTQQQAIAELLNGNIHKHTFFAAKKAVPAPTPEQENMVPFLATSLAKNMRQKIIQALGGESQYIKINLPLADIAVSVEKTPYLADLVDAMDGVKTLAEIYRIVMDRYAGKKERPNKITLKKEFETFYQQLRVYNMIFMRAAAIKPYTYVEDFMAIRQAA